jgi:glycosyltransferase involved in cell wall biosynthesis
LFYSNVEELSRLLQTAIDDFQLVESFREKARARIRKIYSWDAITDQYEKLFRDLCR